MMKKKPIQQRKWREILGWACN